MNVPEPLLKNIARLKPPAVIAVSGFGGAGKSGFASALGSAIRAPVVGLDAFITDKTRSNYAHWEVMDFDRLESEVLRPFTEGRRARYGRFDWAKNLVGESRELPAAEAMIVEGVGLFRPGLLKYFSLLIWVDCPLQEAIRRGKQRDRKEYNNPQDEAWDGIWKENDEQCLRDYRPREVAHFIIDNAMIKTSEAGTP